MKNAVQFDFGIPYQQPTTTVTTLIGNTWGSRLGWCDDDPGRL